VTGGGITRTVSVSLTLNTTATSSATLTWDANAEPDLASYRIYRSNTQGVYGAALATIPAGTLNYLATGLQVGNTYYFTVTAVDTAGNESIRSNEVNRSVF
jgi:fibronectin type 3 domain-containing protein